MQLARRWFRQMRFGIGATVLILLGTWIFVASQGPLFGVWGWPELVLGTLILTASALAGAVMFFRQPNPYSRSHPLYDLRDVPPDRGLDSGGAGWIVQSVPLVVTALILALIFILA